MQSGYVNPHLPIEQSITLCIFIGIVVGLPRCWYYFIIVILRILARPFQAVVIFEFFLGDRDDFKNVFSLESSERKM